MPSANPIPESIEEILRPSRANLWVNDPGGAVFLWEHRHELDWRVGDAAHEGTRLHDLAAQAFLLGEVPSGLDPDDKEILDEYVGGVLARCTYPAALVVEESIPRFYSPGTCTPDAVEPDAFALYDLKTGFHPVPAEGNLQLAIYAVSTWGSEFLRENESEVFSLWICQPRTGGPAWDRWEVTGGELLFLADEIFTAYRIVIESLEGRMAVPQIHAGEAQCRFCPAVALCPAKRQEMLDKLPDEARVPVAPSLLSDSDLARVLDAAPELTKWLDAAKDAAKARLSEGREIPGWKLVPGRKSRDWKDADQADLRIRQRYGLRVDDIRELRSPAQIERVIKAAGKKPRLDDLIETREGRPSLAPASSKRPSLHEALSRLLPE